MCFFSRRIEFNPSSWDQTIRIWNLPNGELVKELNGHTSWVEDCCYTPDGRYIVSAGWDTMIAIWDAYSGHCYTDLSSRKFSLSGFASLED